MLKQSKIVVALIGLMFNCVEVLFAQEISTKAVLMLKSPKGAISCRITRFTDPVVMKENLLNEISLHQQYQPITIVVWSGVDCYQLNVGEASASVFLSAQDTLWMDYDLPTETWKLVKGTRLELNRKIQKLDSLCDNTLLKFSVLPPARRVKEMRYFADTLRKSTPFMISDYYSVYLKYRTAYCEIIADARKRSDLAKMHFSEPAHPGNPAYMEAFKELFGGYIRQRMNSASGDSLKKALQNTNYEAYRSEIARDTVLGNVQVRDLIGLLGIFEEGSAKQFERKVLIDLTSQFMEKNNDLTVKSVAQLMLYDWERFQKGKLVKDFSYQVNNAPKRLSELKGKPVYLCYYPVYNQETRRELLMLKGMFNKYKSEMHFLVVVRTPSESGLAKANAELAAGFDVVPLSVCSPEFTELFEDSMVRTYVLIDRKGAIWQAPAEGPETGVEAAFPSLIKK